MVALVALVALVILPTHSHLAHNAAGIILSKWSWPAAAAWLS